MLFTPTPLLRGLHFPEGPLVAPDGALWCVELQGGALVRTEGGTAQRHEFGGEPCGLALAADGALLVCDAGRGAIIRFDPRQGTLRTICNEAVGLPLDRPNDLAFDTAGNLLFSCPGNSRTEPTGYVCVLTPDGTATRFADGFYFPNGLAFAPDGETLIVAETYRHRLWRGRWDASTRTWNEASVWATPGGPIGPDGMAFDEEGTLYVAVFGQGKIARYLQDGSELEPIFVPGPRPTNCAFAPGEPLLYVTEAHEGTLWQIQTDVPGLRLSTGPAGSVIPLLNTL